MSSIFELMLSLDRQKQKDSVYYSLARSSSGRQLEDEVHVTQNQLGLGGFSFVRMAYKGKVAVAVKTVEKGKIWREFSQEERGNIANHLLLEASILSMLSHPNIIKLLDVYENESYWHLVLEHMESNTLFEIIDKHGNLKESTACHIYSQVLNGVKYLHQQGVVHNDIKDENILISRTGQVKLIDFGSSCFITEHPTRSYCGCETFSSPEVLAGKYFSRIKQEIFSLGVLLYLLVCGEYPFASVVDNEECHLSFPKEIPLSQACEDLIRIMLAKCPGDRPALEHVLASNWLVTAGTIANHLDIKQELF